MANALNGVFMTRLSKLTLDALLTMDLPVTGMWTDFSSDIQDYGNAVTTRYPNTVSAQNFLSAKTAIDVNTVARTITLNKYIGVPIAFSDTEESFTDFKLSDMFIKPALTALFENVMATVQAQITIANFASNVVYAAANFTAANVAAIAEAQTVLKVPSTRTLIIPPTYATKLKTDTSVQAAYAYGSNQTITTGRIPRVYNYDVMEWNGTIPTNSENLFAYAFAPQALLLAVRPPKLPRNWYGDVKNVTVPGTGLTVQIRDYYDGTNQRTEWCFIYGTQIGNPGNLTRITNV